VGSRSPWKTIIRELNALQKIMAMGRILLASFLLTVVFPACSDDPEMDESPMTEKESDDVFAEVVEGSYMGFDCSPQIDDPNFRGIVLNAPKLVKYVPGNADPIHGGFARIIVCATYEFGYRKFDFDGDIEDNIVFVAVDDQTSASYSGTMEGIDNEIPEWDIRDDMGGSDDEEQGYDQIAGYINPNLAVIMDLPEKEADYIVYAILEDFESNRVKISVRMSEE